MHSATTHVYGTMVPYTWVVGEKNTAKGYEQENIYHAPRNEIFGAGLFLYCT